MTDISTPTLAPPSMYPGGDTWAEDTSSPWYIEPSLRAAYAAAVADPATVGRILAEAEAGKRGRYRWVPFAQAERMREAGELLPQVAEAISEDQRRVQVKVRISGAEALHAVRLAQAEQAAAPPSPAVAPVVLTCAGCGTAEQTTAAAVVHADIKRHSTGLPFRLGLGDVLLCARCAAALPAVVAAEAVGGGRTRGEALASLLGLDSSGQSRAEQDRAKVRALVEEKAAERG